MGARATQTWAEDNLSRLMLGTVQLGVPYGIANRSGQPDYRTALAIVAAAVEGGVNAFDTAAAYGTSEEILGRALHELGVADRVLVVTKVRPLTPDEVRDPAAASRAIEESVERSRRRLRLDCLPAVLFHREADAEHLHVLDRLQSKGLLRYAGVSCDSRPDAAARLAATPGIAALQIPASVLDPRHLRAGSLAAASERGVAVFVRSVYLQGLLLMPECDIPAALRAVVPVRRALAAIADEAGIGLAELALRYMLRQAGVTCLLIGAESVAQVRENLALAGRGPLDPGLARAVESAVPDLPEAVTTPALWPAREDKDSRRASESEAGTESQRRQTMKQTTKDGGLAISDPVVVGYSAPNETRWGHFQFPSLFRLPGGELMVTVNDADDAIGAYGQPLRRFVSEDEGCTWRDAGDEVPGSSPHAYCAELFDGEYLILTASAPLDPASAGVQLPAPVGKAFAYQEFLFYRVDQCPARLREHITRLPAWRWTPAAPVWTPDTVRYDVPGQLCWTAGKEMSIPRTWFEHAPIRHGGELLYVDYRTNCLGDDGAVPGGFSCVLMVSRDNGHSFQKRSLVASGRVYEPMLADTADGELVCAIRGTDQEQRPMLITRSRDHGCTWELPRPLFDSGVFPALVRLENGLLLLAFGRPGVRVTSSRDGGRTWAEPVPVTRRNGLGLGPHTCGYTNLLPLRGGEALLVYSDFQATGPDGQPCKSIEVRRIATR